MHLKRILKIEIIYSGQVQIRKVSKNSNKIGFQKKNVSVLSEVLQESYTYQYTTHHNVKIKVLVADSSKTNKNTQSGLQRITQTH